MKEMTNKFLSKMQSFSRLNIIGIIVGIIITLGSFWRYFILYLDYDKLIIYVLVGINMMALFYIREKLNKINNILIHVEENVKDNIDDIRNDFKKLKNLKNIAETVPSEEIKNG